MSTPVPLNVKPGAAKPGASRWVQIPPCSRAVLVEPDGQQIVLEEEIGTKEAAVIMDCSRRRVQWLCFDGWLQEGNEWRQLTGRGGSGGKVYRIRRSAVLRFARRMA